MNIDNRSIVRARSLAAARAERLAAIVEDRGTGTLERLRIDALEELGLWTELTIVPLDTLPPTACSIAGIYLPNTKPPRIGIWRAVTRPRAVFTALHELGHHVQANDGDLIDELDAQPDEGAVLEERTSDAFAARVLLPPGLVSEKLGRGTPTAAKVVALWRASGVSRAAACVAAAQQLTSPGHVVLLDESGIVQFSASFGEPPLRRGSDQSTSAIEAARRRSSLHTVTVRESRFVYRDGILGPQMYAQATEIGGYTVVVAVAYSAPWETMSLPAAAPTLKTRWQHCVHCDRAFEVWGSRCQRCGGGFCPTCGKCDCESRVAELTCETCWLVKPAHLFHDDQKTCNDCA